MKNDILARILYDRQFLTQDEIDQWKTKAGESGQSLDEVLIRAQIYTRGQLLQILENHFFCPAVDLQEQAALEPQVVSMIPRRVAEKYAVLAVGLEDDTLKVAFAQPDDNVARDAIAKLVQREVAPMVALAGELSAAITRAYDQLVAEAQNTKRKTPAQEARGKRPHALRAERSRIEINLDLRGKEASAIVDEAIATATRYGVTDIHIQPCEKNTAIRFRLDGILHTVGLIARELTAAVTSRIKILSELDIAESRLPQDGRFSVRMGKILLDMRVSTLPSQFGEKVVVRLLAKDMNLLDLNNLDMPAAVAESYQTAIDDPTGFYLVTGPTGCGKTTTLYATLNAIDRERLNVITLEDPIEYSIPGLTQVQIKDDIGLTFASGLRSILRQDPDVVLLGEIRDRETVEIAMRAALTGHKVFSTIHTNDACQAITRLLDMGTPPFLITATLNGVLAQRLVRKICQDCKQSYQADETEHALLGYPKNKTLYRGTGCASCAGTGYKGRMAVFEYLKMEQNLHRPIIDQASPYAIRNSAQKNGMILMAEFAKRAALMGETSVAEIQRVILSEDGKEQLCNQCQRVVSIEFSTCPFCQAMLKEVCEHCGNQIDSNWEACPDCGHEIERDWQKVFCRHCLAPVDPGWSDCNYCGGALK